MANEWIRWEGGECPVEGGVLVDLMFYDGTLFTKEVARTSQWWEKDIIAYRLYEQQPEVEQPESDMVNHPPHYQSDNGVECIDAIRAALGKDGFIAYCRGNAIKYAWRDKANIAEDMKKAQWYLNRAEQELNK